MINRGFWFGFTKLFYYHLIFQMVIYFLYLFRVIDDGFYMIVRPFFGFYQLIYLIPIIVNERRKNRLDVLRGVVFGGGITIALNLLLILDIFIHPGRYI